MKCTHSVVPGSSIPQDGLADKRHINGSLQQKQKKKPNQYKNLLIIERGQGYVFKFKDRSIWVRLRSISQKSPEMNCFQWFNLLHRGPPGWEQWRKLGKTNIKPHSERALQRHLSPHQCINNPSVLITELLWNSSSGLNSYSRKWGLDDGVWFFQHLLPLHVCSSTLPLF